MWLPLQVGLGLATADDGFGDGSLRAARITVAVCLVICGFDSWMVTTAGTQLEVGQISTVSR